MRSFGAGKLTDESVESAGGDSSQWAVWTPSTPPAVTVEQSWATPGVAVQRVPEESTSVLDSIFSVFNRGIDTFAKARDEVGKIDIFGRQAAPSPVARPPSQTPVWVYLAVPVALLGMVALMRRKPSGGLSRYKRRRRSRR